MLVYLKEHIWQVLLGVNYLLAIVMCFFVVLKNSNPVRTLSYIFALIALPFIGLLAYYFIGQDYRKVKIFEKKHVTDSSKIKKWRENFRLTKDEEATFEERYGELAYKMFNLLRNNEKAIVSFNNTCEVLLNGENKFNRLKEDLKNAKHHIHLEYFVLMDDEVGGQLIDILCDKAQSGVVVRLIYDDVGSSISSKNKKRLTNSGVKHFPFMPVLFSGLTSKLNYRDHRKIVVIDGAIGYVGGINLRRKYDNSFEKNERYWRDTHLRVEGEVVGSLQTCFLLNWDFASKGDLEIASEFFPQVNTENNDPVAMQIAASGPDSDWANIMEAVFSAITMAKEYVYISTPYLVPNAPILTALTTAARSGIDVRIIIPWESDSLAAQYASDSYVEQLLQSNVKVYRYTKGFIHAKTFVVDNCVSSIGTANLDYRSFAINFEVNAIIYGKSIATQMHDTFIEDLKDCDIVELERWQNRSLGRKLKESFSRLWAPLL